MENKNEKNVIDEKDLKGGKTLIKDLDPTSLIIRDEKMKKIVSKSFVEMTEEEKKQLPTAKFRIVSRKNSYTNQIQKYIRLIFSPGIYFERLIEVEKGEETLLKELYPQLFESPKTKEDIVYVDVPVRLYSYYNEEKNTYSYQYSAELCPSIVMRGYNKINKNTGSRQRFNNFSQTQLQVMLLRDLKYRFVLLDKRVVEETEEDSFDDIDD